ncbi:hypothetical protein [uncultured Alteromonas sp.]|uniref:hypothetical protein n=1 Tax=uncultured Alteromonas sp. TaxID=179113 RepID=UPI0030EBE24C|tara:strand:- start:7743 stop:8348 length:606 start_codon:yes stop_codon:yes gene_type:complete
MKFDNLFISEEKPYKGVSVRDKFLARVFGIFNEEIIKIWCENSKSPFSNVGRPTIYDKDGRYYTLDFLLKDEKGNLFVTEMKCEIEYQKYKNLTLSNSKQLNHHRTKRAFQLFLENAVSPNKHSVKVKGEPFRVSGSALVWGRTSSEGIASIKNEFSIAHIISTESVVQDLLDWQDERYSSYIQEYQNWSNQLFNGLTGRE